MIWGKNGSGKTSLLEAIHILSLGKSFKTHKPKSIIKKGENYFVIKGDFLSNNIKTEVAIQTNIKNQQTIKINGKNIKKRRDLIGKNNVVVLSPEDQTITKGGPKERRSFFDRLFSVVNIDYLNILQEYTRTLKQRNALLVSANKNKIIEENLLLWEEKLSTLALKLWGLRKKIFFDYKKSLLETAKKYEKRLNLDIVYSKTVENKKEYQAKLKTLREKDILLGTTAIGPHKDKIEVFWENKNIRDHGSQGEHKIALVLLKLTEMNLIKKKTGIHPTLLLDDVFSKLDLSRSEKLVSYLNSVESKPKEPIQTIITTTDIVNVEQSGLVFNDKEIKSHKLERSWNT